MTIPNTFLITLITVTVKEKCYGYAVSLYNADYCRWMDPTIFLLKVDTGPEDAWNGYSNTRKMLYNTNWDLKIDNDIFLAANACKNYKGVNRTAPRNSSGWFFPIYGSIADLRFKLFGNILLRI